jgi:hypothetical protein
MKSGVSRSRLMAGCLQSGRPEASMRVKVINGTVPNGESTLCSSCRHATIIRGRALDEEIVECQATPMTARRVTFKVTSCSAYSDQRLPTYLQMLEDAWVLQPGSKRRPAGFIRGSELKEEERLSVRGMRFLCDE